MVYRQIDKGKTVRRHKGRIIFSVLLLIFVVVVSGTALGYYIGESKKANSVVEEQKNENSIDTDTAAYFDNKKLKEDLWQIVDSWASDTSGNKSVIIYDLDNNEELVSLNSDSTYNTASLYKLFVVYEGYRRVNDGRWPKSELRCLDLSIRRSDSNCAEELWEKIGSRELDKIIKDDFGILNSNISKLISTPADVTKIMKLFYLHPHINDKELVAKMKDSFLNQPPTEYDWRQGLPSGFTNSKVYNKVGWEYNQDKKYWNFYHDAAIIETSGGRHFIVAVMTNYISFERIRELGIKLDKSFADI